MNGAILLALIDNVRADLAELESHKRRDRDAIMRLSIRLGALEEAAELLGIRRNETDRGESMIPGIRNMRHESGAAEMFVPRKPHTDECIDNAASSAADNDDTLITWQAARAKGRRYLDADLVDCICPADELCRACGGVEYGPCRNCA